jgi:hypothetical protein
MNRAPLPKMDDFGGALTRRRYPKVGRWLPDDLPRWKIMYQQAWRRLSARGS